MQKRAILKAKTVSGGMLYESDSAKGCRCHHPLQPERRSAGRSRAPCVESLCAEGRQSAAGGALWLKGFQRTAHSFIWKHRLNAGTDNCIGVPPQCGIHETDLPIRSADAACAIDFSRKIIAQCKIHLQASRPCRSRAPMAYKTKKP